MRRHVDPELLAGIDMLGAQPVSLETLAATREAIAQMSAIAPLPEVAVDVEELLAEAPNRHPVPLLVYRPAAQSARGAVLHIHGGGYVSGAARMNHASNLALADAIGAPVISVDYRLAPETPHPGPIEDCYTALCWLDAHAVGLGAKREHIAIFGESAGGGLAAVLAQLARDRRGPHIVHQHLIYPMLDDRTVIRDVGEGCGAFVWTPASNAFGWAALLGHAPGLDEIAAYAAAARAEDFSGLPPAFIAVGALDLFVAEDLDYARRLVAAGVPTELHVYPGAYHGFDFIAGAAVSRALRRDSLAALSRAIG